MSKKIILWLFASGVVILLAGFLAERTGLWVSQANPPERDAPKHRHATTKPKQRDKGHDHQHRHHQHMHGSATRPAPRKREAHSSHSIYQIDSTWQTHRGNTIKLSSLQGKIRVIAMIYATCPHACPMTINDMKRIDEGLPPAIRRKVGYVLVTFDPQRDTVVNLRKLAKTRELGARWTLLRGKPDQILELAAVLGVKYRKISKTDYVHSNLITVLNRKGVVKHQQTGLSQDPAATQRVIGRLVRKK